MRTFIAIIAGTGLLVGTALAALYQTGGFTTPPSGTNSVQVVSVRTNYSGRTVAGILQRLVLTGPNGAITTPATSVVQVVDQDGTLLLSATLTNSQTINGTTTNYPGQTWTTNGTWYGYQPALNVTNASQSNMTINAIFTFTN